jgi:rSAM/selenodomain-associated transferase 2
MLARRHEQSKNKGFPTGDGPLPPPPRVQEQPMISVIIPTLDAEASLGAALSALLPAVVDGIVREVIVVDGGSRDRTLKIADQAGVVTVTTARGRGVQLAAGAARARFPWLLFLHADTVLEPGWEREAGVFIDRVETERRAPAAAAFRFALDDTGLAPRCLEALVRLRCFLSRLPYGDQGLLIPRPLYLEVGGYLPVPIMEDVAIVRRLGRSRLVLLRSRAVSSAARYRGEGYVRRVLRNQACLALYAAGVPVERIARLYTRGAPADERGARSFNST